MERRSRRQRKLLTPSLLEGSDRLPVFAGKRILLGTHGRLICAEKKH
jgi:hypothetical protein